MAVDARELEIARRSRVVIRHLGATKTTPDD